MTGGYYLMYRGWQDHGIFRQEKYTEREAWEFLIGAAHYRPGRIHYKGRAIGLARGQLAMSLRDLAKRWRWDDSRVERFFKRLKTEAMIETVTEAGVTVITVCNYDRFQTPPNKTEAPSEAPSEAEPRQYRGSSEAQEKEGNSSKTGNAANPGKSDSEANASESSASAGFHGGFESEFDAWWEHVPIKRSKGLAERSYRRARKEVGADILLAGIQRYAIEVRGRDPGFIKHPSTWLNAKGWLDEMPIGPAKETHTQRNKRILEKIRHAG